MATKISAGVFLPKTPLQQVKEWGIDFSITQFTPKRQKQISIYFWLPQHKEIDNLWTPYLIFTYNTNL